MPPTFQFEKFIPELRASESVNAIRDRVLVCKGLVARVHNGSAVQKCHIPFAVMINTSEYHINTRANFNVMTCAEISEL